MNDINTQSVMILYQILFVINHTKRSTTNIFYNL
ncbi:hypothetical protein pb186bvf_001599 [Paramecium bursaria]